MISHLKQWRNFNIHTTASSSFISLQQVLVILFTASNIDLPLSPVSQRDRRSGGRAQKNDTFFLNAVFKKVTSISSVCCLDFSIMNHCSLDK